MMEAAGYLLIYPVNYPLRFATLMEHGSGNEGALELLSSTSSKNAL
jgi:hypothetical protein